MAFFDTVMLDKEYAEYGIAPGTIFQTKSLYAGGGRFTINAHGKLIEHLARYETDPERLHPLTKRPLYQHVPAGDHVIEYHGDILLYCSTLAQGFEHLVARFTHGLLEWIRPLDEYPDANRVLLVEQGVR
jgi:hypothetical protein